MDSNPPYITIESVTKIRFVFQLIKGKKCIFYLPWKKQDIGRYYESNFLESSEENLLKSSSFFLVLMKYTPVSNTMAAITDCPVISSPKKYQPKIRAIMGFT